ncbi:short-chain dehydrogenase [Salmonella enterica subsp. enterica]|nr:short-chain dehydrogenase [Salmonella enterica subsp. enterica serovar Reading]MLO25847.1 short-chain dehydrogenase [Salmonella enterica subsp. enterica serovar Reading]
MTLSIFSLKNKVTIVTGGAQGIGKIVSSFLAAAGSDIAIFDIADASDVIDDLRKKFGVKAHAYQCDVTDPDNVTHCVETAARDMGTLDLLFNNAGICYHKDALLCAPEEWKKVIDVNLNGIFFVAQAFSRFLINQNKTGNIVNTASMSGTIVNIPQCQASYNSSKAAVVHLTKSLAVELASKGIRVNSISPGYIKTEMTGTVRQDWQDFWIDSIPFKRMGTPEELAGAVIYLLSEASTYTSGADLIIDGCFTTI